MGGAYGLCGACMVFVEWEWEGVIVHGVVHGG